MTEINDLLDSRGFAKPVHIIGDTLTHLKRGTVYVIVGIAWMGENDVWGYVHRRTMADDSLIVRPLSHLCGNRSDGSPRYAEAYNYIQFSDEV